MKAYLAHISINLRLTLRDRLLLFFNYLFPLVFFFIFGQTFKAQQGGSINQVITMVLIIGVLGSGFFGSGLRAVQERETGILRRFKVAPITPTPILVASMVTGLIAYLPSLFLVLLLSHFIYGMPFPERPISLLIILSVGLFAFRSLGLVIAAVVNSLQESQMVIQLLYLPMLFLSGATFPVAAMPTWLQLLAQFMPASYLFTSLQGVLVQKDGILENAVSLAAMLATTVIATFLAVKLFRWEKSERVPTSAKFWLLAAVAPFLVLGAWQYHSRANVAKAKTLYREMRRGRTLLLRGPRIFVGDGKIIETGAVLVKNGRIEAVYEGSSPDPKDLRAEPIEAAGKTLLPGLIDTHVHLVSPGGAFEDMKEFNPDKAVLRALAAYLYSGITAVRSVGDPLPTVEKARATTRSAERLGADLFLCGPMFTAEGGHGTEYFKGLPEGIRKLAEGETTRIPKTPDEARRMVADLAAIPVDGIKAILEAGRAGMLFNRLDPAILRAIGEQAKARHLPLSVHTGDVQDVRDALSAGPSSIEHGSNREVIPEDLFLAMQSRGVAYAPTLSVMEAFAAVRDGKFDLLDRTLVQQVGPPTLLRGTRKLLESSGFAERRRTFALFAPAQDTAAANLKQAWHAGVMLVTGSDAGNFLVIHGPTVHRELQLWVQAGIPPAVALQAATFNAARLLGAASHIGLIRKGFDATLLLVDGNPLEDITATERIGLVLFKGERVDRADLFDQE